MELALKTLLDDSGVAKEVVAHVEKLGVKKLGMFATWINDGSKVPKYLRGYNFGDDEDARMRPLRG